MRVSLLHAATVAAALSAVVQSTRAPDDTAKILADARQALGGEARLSAVHSFTINGEIRYEASQPYGTFEIACELPDKFLQKTSKVELGGGGASASGTSGHGGMGTSAERTTLGFNGNQVILETSNRSQFNIDGSPNRPQRRVPTQAELAPFLPNAHQQFVQMTLALFAASFSSVPLQFLESAGPDDGPTVIVKDRVNAVMRFDKITHLPASLDSLHYSDYRDVDGVKVPFRLVWMRAARPGVPAGMWQQWDVKAFHVNTTIDPKVFRPSGLKQK